MNYNHSLLLVRTFDETCLKNSQCKLYTVLHVEGIQSNDEANRDNDIPAARDSYRVYKMSVWGLSFWFGIVLGLTITLGILGGVGVL